LKAYWALNLSTMEFDAEDFGANFYLYFNKILYFAKKKRDMDKNKSPDFMKELIDKDF
jgi:hypothetical protein